MREMMLAASFRDYLELTKPKVVMLIVFTAIVGMFLSTPGMVPVVPLLLGTLGIGLAASAAAVVNHVIDQHIDERMGRTQARPLPQGSLTRGQALVFSGVLAISSMLILGFWVNPLTAVLTFGALIGYAIVYTVWLKHATPQNIVIGGAAGAAPPVLGWVAITGEVHAHALLLFLIIFAWTPPHFWALAIARRDDYANAGVPMLPVTHGVRFTSLQMLFYTVLLVVVTVLPFATHMSGPLYLAVALVLGVQFIRHSLRVIRQPDAPAPAMRMFAFSITYLNVLFAALLVDHYLPLVGMG